VTATLRLHFRENYAALIREAITQAKPEAEKFTGTKWRDDEHNPREIKMLVPLREAGAWIRLLEDLAEQSRATDPERADKFEYVADIFQEESEALIGYAETAPAGRVSREVKRNFWKGM
jgi:hypothetical protein